MSRLARGARAFGAFWWDFLVGDDWRLGAGVVVALGLTGALASTSIAAWWLLPVAVAGLLVLSLRGATRPPG